MQKTKSNISLKIIITTVITLVFSLSIAKSVHADPPTYEEELQKVSGPEFQTPLQRGDLTPLVNMGRLDAFMNAFLEVIQSAEFRVIFTNVTLSRCWIEQIKKECLENSELDFVNKTFHSSSFYGAEDQRNQITFDVGCSIIVQIASRVLLEDPESCLQLVCPASGIAIAGLDEEDDEHNPELYSTIAILALMAKLRWKMQCIACPEYEKNGYFYTLGMGNLGIGRIYDQNPVDTQDRSDYLKSLQTKATLLRGVEQESDSPYTKYSVEYSNEHGDCLGNATVGGKFRTSIFNDFGEILNKFISCGIEKNSIFCTLHSNQQVMMQEPLQEFFASVKENRPLDELRRLVLSMDVGLNHSTTYIRGQGSLTLMWMRAMFNVMGHRLTLVGKWHPKSPYYPFVIDALLFNYGSMPAWCEEDNFILDRIMPSKFIQDHEKNLLVQPLSDSTKHTLELAARMEDPPAPEGKS
jgi:hypothetical protein